MTFVKVACSIVANKFFRSTYLPYPAGSVNIFGFLIDVGRRANHLVMQPANSAWPSFCGGPYRSIPRHDTEVFLGTKSKTDRIQSKV